MNTLNMLTCQYEQLELVVDEISLVGARMVNVIDNRIRSIKHIQNKNFVDLDFIVAFFRISKMMFMHQHQIIGKHMSNVTN
jgi:hypothetical protein